MIEPGQTAPDFELPDQDGNPVRLSDLRGGRVVLYFYPKADTPGCTTQACGIRDHRADYDAAGATVLGVSPDPVKAVKKFHDKQGLDFTLLADSDHAVAEQYGVWVEKSMYGRTYMGNAARDLPHRRRGRRPPRHPQGLAEDARRRGPRRARARSPRPSRSARSPGPSARRRSRGWGRRRRGSRRPRGRPPGRGSGRAGTRTASQVPSSTISSSSLMRALPATTT